MEENTQPNGTLNSVFVVEDDRATRESIAMSFEISYPGISVTQFIDASGVLEGIEGVKPDMVSVDLGLPGRDGLSLIRDIREISDVPIIVVSARDDDSSLVAAIRLGADAFLVKPISLVGIQAHVEAIVRMRNRVAPDSKPDNILRLGDCTVDLARGSLEIHGVEESLTKIELCFLKMLGKVFGRVVPMEDLKTGVWGDPNVSDATVKMAVHRLRQKLGDEISESPIIVNHRSIGYSLVES
jgi:DNA-binding response OmpR family regulator